MSVMGVNRRKKAGQSIIEMVVGVIVLVPIVIFLLDMALLILANSANDNLAKSCARAAASATNGAGVGNGTQARVAATNIADNFQASTIISKVGGSFMTGFCWNPDVPGFPRVGNMSGAQGGNPDPGQVAVHTTMRVSVPLPLPGLPTAWNFSARAVEPIVSLPPQ